VLEDSIEPNKWKSRKLRFSLLCLALITAGFFAREELASLEGVYAQFVTGVLGILTVYLGSNVSNKYVIGKSQQKQGDTNGPNGQ